MTTLDSKPHDLKVLGGKKNRSKKNLKKLWENVTEQKKKEKKLNE